MSTNFMSFLDAIRSATSGVGNPPDQKKPSISPDSMSATVSSSDSCCAEMSRSGCSPAASSRRFAITSVPDFAAPVEIFFPFMSSIVEMPLSSRTMTCV